MTIIRLGLTTRRALSSTSSRFVPFPMNLGGGAGIFTAAPDVRSDWRFRFQATLLLPRQ